MARKDYGDKPGKSYSIIKHLRGLVPGKWHYQHPGKWLHVSGICVWLTPDYVKARILYIVGMDTVLARGTETGWQWDSQGEALLKRLIGAK